MCEIGTRYLYLRASGWGWDAQPFPYRPDIKAPTKFKMVLIRVSGKTLPASSLGIIRHDLFLECMHEYKRLDEHWYCPETGERNNWDDEWTPDEYRYTPTS